MNEIAIRNIDDLKVMAQTMGVSALLPEKLRGKPADVFVTIMYGHELGLTPMASVQGIYVVNGRPTLSAQTWLALARRAGHRVVVSEHTDEMCTVVITRGDTGEEHLSTYTYAEAVQAKLADKDVWKAHRKAMLLARAVSQGCRFACPEIALGAYAEGELDDDVEAPQVDLAEIQEAEVVEPDADATATAVADIEAEFVQVEELPVGADDND